MKLKIEMKIEDAFLMGIFSQRNCLNYSENTIFLLAINLPDQLCDEIQFQVDDGWIKLYECSMSSNKGSLGSEISHSKMMRGSGRSP